MINKIVVGVLLTIALVVGFEQKTAVSVGTVPTEPFVFDNCTFAPVGNHLVYQDVGPDFNPVMAQDSKGNLYVALEHAGSATDHDIIRYYFNKPNKKWYPSNTGGFISSTRDHRQPYIFFDSYDNYYMVAKGPPPSTYIGVDTTLFWWVMNDTLFTVPGTEWYQHCSYPTIAVNETGIWFAMQVDTAGQSDIRVLYQASGSSSVYTANVAATPVAELHPSIAAGSSYAVVAYEYKSGSEGTRVLAARAADQNFEDPVVIAGTTDTNAVDPFVAASGSNFYIGYTEGNDVGLAYSSDDGASFKNTAIAATPSAERRPAVAAHGNKVYVVYLKDSTMVMHRKSTDGGATWSSPERVSDNMAVVVDTFRATAIARHPEDSTYIAWVDNRNRNSTGWDIYSALAGEASGIAENRGIPPGQPILKCAPSPFTRFLTIGYTLARPGRVRLAVYDAVGNLIKALESGEQGAGMFELRWNGCDERGKFLPAGVYFIRLMTEKENRTERVILLR